MQKNEEKRKKKGINIGYLIGGLLYLNYNPEKGS